VNNDTPSIEDLLKKKPVEESTPVGTPSVTEVFASKMQDIGLQEKEQVAKSEAGALHVGYVNLVGFPISPEALTLIPEEQARELQVICFLFTGPELRIAALHPEQQAVQELAYQLQERNKATTGIYKVTEHSFETAMKMYETLPKIKAVVKGVRITEEELARYQALVKDFPAIHKLLNEASTTDVLTIVIAAALELDSSDIHVEAEENGVKVRLRVDGILQDVAVLPVETWKKIISRGLYRSGLGLD